MTMGIVVVALRAAVTDAELHARMRSTLRRQFGGQVRIAIEAAFGPAEFDGEILAFDPAALAKTFAKRGEMRSALRIGGREKADARNPALRLRAQRARKRERAAHPCHESAPVHSPPVYPNRLLPD
ncbi:MAG: hypothetical protein K8S22_16260 [Betaproteobacteria bacterium]|nr:hypothetical protein [Betaproteobacteria bacterium]